ncbi:MAG: sigma 54-interacting transcriptional regulator [Pyrinomonadaceae bacterium]
MEASIKILFGGSAERSFRLTEEKTCVGRGDENKIQINHSSVSRKHCVIEKKGSDFYISDQNSLNGTFVRNTRAENTKLISGDRIQIGDFTAIFELEDKVSLPESQIAHVVDAKLRLPPNYVFLPVQKTAADLTGELSALLSIAGKISVIEDTKELQIEILRQTFKTVPANDGAIVLVDDNLEFVDVTPFSRLSKTNETRISKTIVERVLREGSAILAADVAEDDRRIESESLMIAGTISLLCVPLIVFERTIGAIYLTTNSADQNFKESHLQLVTAVSSIAAVAIENAGNVMMLRNENARLKTENILRKNMIGESEPMQRVFDCIAKTAPTDSTVLITGESGTGKELAAHSIHVNSLRAGKPFVVINCAAITETLLESELFGHEKGAFTDAGKQKKGKIELANGGTLFLDEIGELAQSVQVKLLRVLQEREFERVGGTSSIKVDIRLIAATNRDLEAEVKSGKFREDLFYRLNVIELFMPPLRNREGDILILADEFIKKYRDWTSRPVRGLAGRAKRILADYEYPGNVRELENAIESAVVLGTREWIQPEDLPDKFSRAGSAFDAAENDRRFDLQEGVKEAKRKLIAEAFKKAKGNYVKTARLLDVHPNYLHRLIRTLDIKSELEG